MKHFKVSAVLLLLVQVLHVALLQDSTDSPGRTIDKSWLRQKLQNKSTMSPIEGSENTEETEGLQSNDDRNGIASGYMASNSDEEENLVSKNTSENKTSQDLNIIATTLNPVSDNGETKQQEMLNSTVPSSTTLSSNSSQINMTKAEEELNSTVTTTANVPTKNSTSFPVFFNDTELHSTTLAPENNATEESTTTPDEDEGLTNQTGSTNATTVTTTAAPEINETSSTSPSTTVLPSETSETSTVMTTTALPNTPERANKTGKGAGSSEKGIESDPYRSKRSVAWVAVLGTAAAVACVGLVAYIILKKKHQKGFTHRKLVEEYPSDPVLRLDNSEPLDLNFGGSAYYNPGLQGDSIQMTNFPGRR